MSVYTKLACFAGGALFGSFGVKLLSSKDAKKAYVHVTAAGLRMKDSVMGTVTVSYTHLNDAVRKACPVKKVSSSRSKNQTVILSETELDTEAVMNAIRSTGYEVGTIQKEPYKKRGLFG